MKKIKSLCALLLTTAMLLAMTACGGDNANGPVTSIDPNQTEEEETPSQTETPESGYVADDTLHAIGGGASGGGYYTISNVLAEYFKNKGFGQFVAQPTSGGGQNGLLMQAGDLDVGIINGADSYGAYSGTSDLFEEPYTNMRAIAVLYSGLLQITVQNDDSIQHIEDLVGKKVVVGGPGSGDNAHVVRWLGAAGYTMDDIDAQYVGTTEGFDMMKDDQAAGISVTGSVPFPQITELTMAGKAKVLPLTEEEIEALCTAEDSVYFPTVVPAGSYDGQDEDIPTVALPTILCVDAERISEDLAYEMTKALYEDPEVPNLYNGFDLDAEASIEACKIPFHPGAEKYYKEIGVLQ